MNIGSGNNVDDGAVLDWRENGRTEVQQETEGFNGDMVDMQHA